MKKFHSLLAIILILTCLLSVLASCGRDQSPAEETTKPVETPSDDQKTYPMTEKDKANIFATAMSYLAAKNFDAAYDELIKIPDYHSEGNASVAEYLSRFHYQYETVYLFANDDANYTSQCNYSYNDYGFETAFRKISAKDGKEYNRNNDLDYINNAINGRTYDENARLTFAKTGSQGFSYVYDEVTGLLIEMKNHVSFTIGSDIKASTKYTYDENNRLIKEIKYDVQKVKVDSSTTEFVYTEKFTIDYSYNDQGLLAKATRTENGASIDTLYTYDAKGNLISMAGLDEDGSPCSITYEYNEKGQLTKRSTFYKNADGTDAPKTTFVLSKETEVLSRISTFTYDDLGRLTNEDELITELKVPEGGTEKAPATMTVHHFYEQYRLFYNPYN